ncbi:MAG: hypothetical protein HYZ79_01050 [Candidatus Melainabacteria bacterium]|nr:hypothetical protein [Candidatus Melainabacteria bacterium]
MLFSRSISGHETSVLPYVEVSSSPVRKKRVPISTPLTAKEREPKTSTGKKFLHWFTFKNKWHLLKKLTSGAIIAYATAKTPGLWLALDSAVSTDALHVKPQTVATRQIEPSELAKVIDIDNLVENGDSFPAIYKGIKQAGISDSDLKNLDLNNTGTILDNSQEIEKLVSILTSRLETAHNTDNKQIITDAINTLEETKIINRLLWGDNGLETNSIHQVNGNCQIVSGLIAHSFTPENAQKLKSLVKVTRYKLDKYFNEIDSVVSINGKEIIIPHQMLAHWRGLKPNQNTPEGPYILSYAIEQELAQNYTPNPYGLTSPSSATFITGQNHTMIFVPILSDNSLIDIIKNAPGAIVTAGTYPSFKDYFGTVNSMLGGRQYSDEEPKEYNIIPHHEYAIKGYENRNGENLITLVATNPNKDNLTEVTLTLDEFRSHFMTITAKKDSFSAFDAETLRSYLIAIMLLLVSRNGINYIEKKRTKPKTEIKIPT